MSHKKKPKQSPKKEHAAAKPEQITTMAEFIGHPNKTERDYDIFDGECGWQIWQKGDRFYAAFRERGNVRNRKSFTSEQAALDYVRSKSKG
ncbi:MAG: hypothetical protein K6A75_09140 [Ruminococcus sp.]|nr:hypothetical protein [Ruminococcus sp.]